MNSMKRVLLVVLVALTSVAAANAQFKWGIKAGMNINKLHFSQKDLGANFAPENSTGWNAGVMAEFTVPVIGVGLDAAVMYSRMNNSLPNRDITGVVSEEGSLFGRNFIEIPINVKYKFTIPVVSSILKPMVFTGPSFAFKLDKNLFKNIKTKTCETAWNVGLGLEFFNHLQVTGAYAFGMNNIAGGIFNTDAVKVKVKNSYWTVSAAYLF